MKLDDIRRERRRIFDDHDFGTGCLTALSALDSAVISTIAHMDPNDSRSGPRAIALARAAIGADDGADDETS